MSNPTVFELNKQEIRNNIICIEDNIGESVHFHIGMVRFDLTVEEFLNVTNTLSDVLGNLINIENFVLKEQDEVFIQRIAYALPYLKNVTETSVNLNQLKYRYEGDGNSVIESSIEESPVYRYYNGENIEIDEYNFEKEIWQPAEELLEFADKNNEITNIFVDENLYILDGYKTACSLLKKNGGNYNVKVHMIITEEGHEVRYALMKVKKKW